MGLVDNNNHGGTNNADVQYLRFDFRGDAYVAKILKQILNKIS